MNNPIHIIDKHIASTHNDGDGIARLKSVDVRNSCIVAAPAGSGKTEILTQRFLALLGTVTSPEQILAITFTKKAASEMRDRIFTALRGANDNSQIQPHQQLTRDLANCVINRSKELDWNILDNTNQMKVRTIDSLYASIAKRAPMASRIGGGMRVSNSVNECYDASVKSLFELIDEPSDWQPHMVNLLTALDNRLDIAKDMLVSLLQKREQWLPIVVSSRNDADLRQTLEKDLATVIENNRKAALCSIRSHITSIQDIALFSADHLPSEKSEQGIALRKIDDVESTCWKSIYKLLFTTSGDVRKSATATIGFPAPSSVKDKELKGTYKEAKDSFKEVVAALRSDNEATKALTELSLLPNPRYEDADWVILESLLKLLPVLAGHLLLEFKAFGCVDHTAVSSAAICALGQNAENPSDLSLSLDNQLKHILVDEFQDTNNVQILGLNLLMEGWEPEDGRSLFCVGDAMQSIYGFRGSNVGLFIDAASNGIGETPLLHLTLDRNFRSSKKLVNWFNQFFQQAFPSKHRSELGEIAYGTSVPTVNDGVDTPVSIKAFVSTSGESKKSEAFSIASEVSDISTESPNDSVAILVRSRSHLSAIVPALKAKGIAYQAIDIDPLERSPMVADLKALTLVILDPTDRISWLALLRSPLCGLTSADMISVSIHMRDALIDSSSLLKTLENLLSSDGYAQFSKLINVLKSASEHTYRKSCADIIEGAWLALSGPAAYPLLSSLEYGDQYIEMLRGIDGRLDAKTVSSSLSKLYAIPAAGIGARVHLLTLHKSKGLEYDHVFIPSCERGSPSDSKQLLAWDFVNENGSERSLLSPGDAINDSVGSIAKFLVKRNKTRTNNELVRLLYVGCTRARKTLHLSFCGVQTDDGELKAPRQNTFATYLCLHAGSQIETVVNGPLPLNESPIDFVQISTEPTITRVKSSAGTTTLPEGNLLEDYRGRLQSNNAVDASPDKWSLQYAHHMGTLLHRITAMICERGVDFWQSEDLARYRKAWQAQLNQLGVPHYLLEHFSIKIDARINTLLANKDSHWVFSNSKDDRSEVKFQSSEGVHTKTHIFDRIVKNNTGTWIIDYKSDERRKDESTDRFHARIVSEHKNQLQRYGDVYTKSTGDEQVRMAIYAYETGSIVECT